MIEDFDDAYANGAHIPGAERYPPAWAAASAEFRAAMAAAGRAEIGLAYADPERCRLDLFRPEGAARGLLVLVHGGYWKAFGRSDFSHLAAGAVARGWAVALPGHTLAPGAGIAAIGREIAAAVVRAAGLVAGPIVVSGHSAGGQLAARMASAPALLPAAVAARIRRVVPISGLFDLRPLMATAMNAVLALGEAEAVAESPALQRPLGAVDLLCWVGAAERPEFRRQSALLANVWTGLGARTRLEEAPGRHHFDVINDLADPGSRLLDLALA